MSIVEDWRQLSSASGEGNAHGLPGRAYLDKDVLDLEVNRWLTKSWLFVGGAHELQECGDLLPIPYLRIFLARGVDNVIRAFHNICRHRGHELVDTAKTSRRNIVCPYHGWCYDLTGKLAATSQFSGVSGKFAPGFKPDNFGLKSIRCEQWHDWIFVNLDGDAPPLDSHLGPLKNQLADFDFTNLRHLHTLEHGEVKANWKLIMENSLEPYHTPFIHKSTGGGIPLEDHYMIVEEGLIGCGIDMPDKDSDAPSLTEKGLTAESLFLSVPPLLIFVVYDGSTVIVHRNIPNLERPDRTWRSVYLYSIGDKTLTEKELQDWIDITYKIHVEEDGPVYENLQRGKLSPVTNDGGILSPVWETAVAKFFETWAHKLNER
jgi:choline monooxygenase